MSQLCGYSSGKRGHSWDDLGGSGKGVQQRGGRLEEGAGLWERVPHTVGTF